MVKQKKGFRHLPPIQKNKQYMAMYVKSLAQFRWGDYGRNEVVYKEWTVSKEIIKNFTNMGFRVVDSKQWLCRLWRDSDILTGYYEAGGWKKKKKK